MPRTGASLPSIMNGPADSTRPTGRFIVGSLLILGALLALLRFSHERSRPAPEGTTPDPVPALTVTPPQSLPEPMLPPPDAEALRQRAAHRTLPPIRVAVLSDLNASYGSTEYNEDVHRAVQAIIEADPDLVISVGDMVAGQRRGLNYRGMWRGFHEAVSDPLRRAGIPFAVTPGNHDASVNPSFAEERNIFIDEWTRRRPDVQFVDRSQYPLRYSFVVGPAFFVSLDATGIGPLERDQMRWLEAQLELGASWPVRIVFGHVPLYATARTKAREVIGDPALEALLRRHEVTMMIGGHHHTYYPGARGSLRLLAMPCLGSGLRALMAPEGTVTPRAWVMLGVDHAGIYELDAWRAPDFSERIERSSLPDKVGSRARPITRDDIVGFHARKPRPAWPTELRGEPLGVPDLQERESHRH